MKVDVGLVAERQATVNDKITRVAVTETGSILITNTPSLNSDTAKPDITPPQGPRPQVPEAEPTWSPDELDALASLAHHFQNNHEIIASALAGMHVGSAPRKRTPWQCYDQLCLQRVHAHPAKPKTGYLFAPPSRSSKARLADNKTKALRLLTFFDQVKKCARKRDLSRANQRNDVLMQKSSSCRVRIQ